MSKITQYEDDQIREIIEEIFRADKSITHFRLLQMAGLENWQKWLIPNLSTGHDYKKSKLLEKRKINP